MNHQCELEYDGNGNGNGKIENEYEFDYIIVGAGPSASGFLYGFLKQREELEQDRERERELDKDSKGGKKKKTTIAVLERGPFPPAQTNKKELQQQQQQEPHQWPKVALRCTAAASSSNPWVQWLETRIGYRITSVPTGQGMGGTTNINASLLIPPAPHDFQSWPWKDMMQNVASIQDALVEHNAMMQVETSVQEMLVMAEHNTTENNNETSITANKRTTTTLDQLYRETTFPSFHTRIPMALKKRTNITATAAASSPYQRINMFEGLVEPLLNKTTKQQKQDGSLLFDETITFFHNTQVQRLLFTDESHGMDKNTVIGVEASTTNTNNQDILLQFRARKDVILCAGAMETPALLLASGIGREDDLKRAGIPSRGCHLDVGYNLQDHVLLPVSYLHRHQTDFAPSPNTVQALHHVQDDHDDNHDDNHDDHDDNHDDKHENDGAKHRYFQFMLCDSTSGRFLLPIILSEQFRVRWSSTSMIGRILQRVTNSIYRLADVFLHFLADNTPFFTLSQKYVFTTNLVLLNPQSMGRVVVTRATTGTTTMTDDKNDVRNDNICVRRRDLHVTIEDCYLSHPADFHALRRAWIQSQRVCSKWFAMGTNVLPGAMFSRLMLQEQHHDDDASKSRNRFLWELYVKSVCLPYYHWCGSCSRNVLVEEDEQQQQLRVLPGLRLCDASVFWTLPSCPTALTCAALGYGLSKRMFGGVPVDGSSSK